MVHIIKQEKGSQVIDIFLLCFLLFSFQIREKSQKSMYNVENLRHDHVNPAVRDVGHLRLRLCRIMDHCNNPVTLEGADGKWSLLKGA